MTFDEIKTGDRVKYIGDYVPMRIVTLNRIGTVVIKNCGNPNCVTVQFEGETDPRTMHVSVLAPVNTLGTDAGDSAT
jgi:hypothetical protein